MCEEIVKKPDYCPKCGSVVLFKKDPYVAQVKCSKGMSDKGPSDDRACFVVRCNVQKCS